MEERSAKQSFLSKEIIEKGYDGDLFMSYCESIKGTEVDDYTLQELKYIVAQFQKTCKLAPQSSDSFLARSPSQDIKDPNKDKQAEDAKSEVLNNSVRKSETSAYSIEAVKMQDNYLSLEEIINVSLKE